MLISSSAVFGQEEDFNILNKWIKWNNYDGMLLNHLNKQAFDYLDLRDKEISKLKTKNEKLKTIIQNSKLVFALES